jgi:hypothetical protein
MKQIIIIIIISLLMSPLLGSGLPYGLHIRRSGHNSPRGPITGWWVLTTANAAGTNGLTCPSKHGGARGSKFLVTNPMTDQCCLTSATARRSALTAGPSGSSFIFQKNTILLKRHTKVKRQRKQSKYNGTFSSFPIKMNYVTLSRYSK